MELLILILEAETFLKIVHICIFRVTDNESHLAAVFLRIYRFGFSFFSSGFIANGSLHF